MPASVYILRSTRALTTLDVGRNDTIAEIDVPAVKENTDIQSHFQARRELSNILRDSQFKNMVAAGSLRMAPEITIANVVKVVMRALREADGVAPKARGA